MTTKIKGIDIAWARPDTDGIKATGAKWVARYFSNDPSKDLTAAEVVAYPAAGLGIVTVRETTANRAGQGYAAGVADAQAAIGERRAVGIPDGTPIHFAVDYDATPAQVQPYFDGIVSVFGAKTNVGVYGGYRIAEWAHSYKLKYIWQTEAWSNGAWSQWATIRQEGGTTLSGGADYDDAMTADFGQFPRPVTTPVTPPPPEDDFMVLFKDVNEFKAAVGAAVTDTAIRDELGAVAAYWVGLGIAGVVSPGMTAFEKQMVTSLHAQFQAAVKAAK
jgi:hypothetical protein